MTTTVTPLATYRNQTPYPFCPGCGHGPILDALNSALGQLRLDAEKVVIVSDIGCSGLSDQYFATHAFHGLHGRSITYASGIKLARPELTVVVVMGDGGTGIGGAHLLAAARRNIGLTVLVFNNFNFGMTGGQHSPTTPPGARTSTTPGGHLERPLDLCATVTATGAAYAWRGTSFDADLADRIAEGIGTPGFALLDVWELCTAHYVPRNKASRRTLSELLEGLDFPTGVLARREVHEYSAAYRQAHAEERGAPIEASPTLPCRFTSSLDRSFRLVVAGSAGAKVRSSTRLLATAAVLSGLWVSQRDDYPVTVKTGHSLSELVLSPEEIHYTGITRPDALVLLSEPGRKKAARYLAKMGPDDVVFALPELAGVESRARVVVVDPASFPSRLAKTHLVLATLAAAVRRLGLLTPEALEEAARLGSGEHAVANLEAVKADFDKVAGSPRG